MSVLDDVRRRVAAIGPEGLARRASWASVVEVAQLVGSLLVFFSLANLMALSDYGRLGGVLAIAAVTSSLGSFGCHVLLIKRVSQGMDLAQAWGRATSMSVMGLGLSSLLVIAIQPLLQDNVDRLTFALLIVSQVNFFWLTELAVYVGNGTRRLKEAAQIRLLVLACRLSGLGWFALFGGGELRAWAWASMVSFGVAVVLAVGYVWVVFGARPALFGASWADVGEGAPFSANSGSESLVDASDRPLLNRYGLEADAGIYSLGARIAQLGYLPLRILMRASDADLFEAGARGVVPALRVTRSLLPTMLAIAVVVGAGMLIMAPVVPIVAGEEWNETVATIRFLAALPVIRAVQYLLGNTLSASDLQWWRVGATLAAAVVNFGLNLALLPGGSWRTAVFTTIVSELFLTAVLAFILFGQALHQSRGYARSP